MKNSLFILVLTLWACNPAAMGEPDPHITPVPGADKCSVACAHMGTAGPDGGACEEALPITLADGGTVSCTDFCRYQHANGVYWNTDCLMQVKFCSDIEKVCNIPPP